MSKKDIMQVIDSQETKFKNLDQQNGGVLTFTQECLFAKQQILKSDFCFDVATNNPASLQASILNVAAIGISLNPALQQAFLVPRDKSICLDISYRGLVKLATDTGSICWAKAELVYSNDTFKYRGVNQAPVFEADVFGDRGALKGGFCIAKLPSGEVLVDTMTIDEIHKVRDTSKAYKKNSGPWIEWYEEMCKKTLVKRAYKSWPQTQSRARLDKAVEVINETEGLAYTAQDHQQFMRLYNKGAPLPYYIFCQRLQPDTYAALLNSFPKDGTKTVKKQKAIDLFNTGRDQLFGDINSQLIERIEQADRPGTMEILDDLGLGADLLIEALGPEHRAMYDTLSNAA